MRRTKNIFVFLFVALAMSFMFAGCGKEKQKEPIKKEVTGVNDEEKSATPTVTAKADTKNDDKKASEDNAVTKAADDSKDNKKATPTPKAEATKKATPTVTKAAAGNASGNKNTGNGTNGNTGNDAGGNSDGNSSSGNGGGNGSSGTGNGGGNTGNGSNSSGNGTGSGSSGSSPTNTPTPTPTKAPEKPFREKVEESSDIPVISVNTSGGVDIVSRESYTDCTIDVFNCSSAYELNAVDAGIKVRGNSSAYYGDVREIKKNQVPYRIKFNSKQGMLGLHDGNKFKSWVLLKADWDLIRNDIAFRFGRAIIGNDTFCSDAQFVHVYVNEKFKGVYLLCEQCQVGKNRVNISEPEEGYTGTDIGYYLEIDNYAADEKDATYITLDYGGYEVTDIRGETRAFVPAEYSIKSDTYSKKQKDFISKYMNNLFELVYQACENGTYYTFDNNYDLVPASYTNAKDTVCAVMDIDTVVDLYLLYEIVHDYDCGEGSFFMAIDFKGNSKPKLSFTSPWDFNWAYNDSKSRYWAGAFTEKSFVRQYGDRTNPWFVILIKQDWFKSLCDEKWNEVSDDVRACIDEEKSVLNKYKNDLNKGSEWAYDCAYQLFDWINPRLNWMDQTFG